MSKRVPAIIILVLLSVSISLVTAHIYSQQPGYVTQTISNKLHYYVNQLSNVDPVGDKGTHSNFTEQRHGPDLKYDALTEANTGGGSASFGSNIGTSFTTVSQNEMYGSVFTSPANAEGATLQNMTWYGCGSTGSGNAEAVLVLHNTLQIIAVSNAVSFTTSVAEYTCTFASPPTLSANTQYVLMMIFSAPTRFYYSAGNANQGHLDTTNRYATPFNPTDATHNNNQYRIRAAYNIPYNYELDLEVQWTNVDFSEAKEELCIYGGLMGSEKLRVDVWTGSSWQNAIASLNSGWNNVTVSTYLVSSTFTVRFKGSLETTDTTQNSWEIDATLLHLWS